MINLSSGEVSYINAIAYCSCYNIQITLIIASMAKIAAEIAGTADVIRDPSKPQQTKLADPLGFGAWRTALAVLVDLDQRTSAWGRCC
jgi:hypothetical protein